MRARLSHVAVFLALGGTAVAAPLVTGADVKDGTVSGRDVERGSLQTRHLARRASLPRGPHGPPGAPGPPGPPGPAAPDQPSARVYYVEVRADGTPEHPYGVLKVAHPATGVYCLTGHRFRWVDVTSKSVDEAQRAAVLAYAEGQAPEAPCDSGTTARVTIDAPGSPGLDDGPFLFVGSRDADAS